MRARLLVYYYRRPDDSSRRSRLRHIAWLIAHHPDSLLLYSDTAVLGARRLSTSSSRGTRSHFGGVAGTGGRLHPDDVRVLENAVRDLRQASYPITVGCLKRLRQIEPTNPRWVVLLASQYVAAIGNSELAPNALADLQTSADLPLVGLAGQGLCAMGKKAQALPLTQYGESLLHKAQLLDPLNLRWSANATESPALLTERDMWPYGTVPVMKVPDDAFRVAAEAQAAKAIHHEQPLCTGPQVICPQTKTTLKLGALIGKDGRVKSLYASSGDMNTIPLAMDAVRQWTYQPTRVNGQPVEVATEIEVVLAPATQEAVQPRPPVAPPKGSGFVPPIALTKAEAEYTPEAHDAKFEGSVKLSLTVDEQGLPRDIKVSSTERWAGA